MSNFLFIGMTGPKMAQHIQVVSRDEHGSGLERIGSELKPILAGQDWIGLQFFSKLADQDWIGLRKFLLF